MESRYTLLKNAKVRNLAEYNKLGEDPEKLCKKMGITDEREMKLTPKKLPFIVIVVDELADLILEEGKDAEKENELTAVGEEVAALNKKLEKNKEMVGLIGMLREKLQQLLPALLLNEVRNSTAKFVEDTSIVERLHMLDIFLKVR